MHFSKGASYYILKPFSNRDGAGQDHVKLERYHVPEAKSFAPVGNRRSFGAEDKSGKSW